MTPTMTSTVTPMQATLWDWFCAIFFWIPAWVWLALTLRHELREDRALMVRPVEGPPSPPAPAEDVEEDVEEDAMEPPADFTAEVMAALERADYAAPVTVVVQAVCPFCEAAQLETRADGRSVLRIPGPQVPVRVCAHHQRARRLARDRATLAGELVTKPYFVEPPSRASLN